MTTTTPPTPPQPGGNETVMSDPIDKEYDECLRLANFTIENTADAIIWHDANAKIVRVNNAACKQFGYAREELVGRFIQDINPNSTPESWRRFWQELKQSKTVTFEDEHRTRSGQSIPLDVTVNYIEFEGKEYAVGFSRDISKRKKWEAERDCAFKEIQRLREQLELENEYLHQEVRQLKAFGEIVGQSPELCAILKQIEMVAPTDASALIVGESGTGKELIAHEIHKRSQRRARPMIRVNCASIPRELYESEFFGHVKGAFTGAVKDRAGRFELADGGTLFLDEIGEIPLELQGKLLRVLQEGTYERVGEDKTKKVDVRIIAATNRDLKTDMERGAFRRDLYYRLSVFPIDVVPLRKRSEDIPLLAVHFAENAAQKFHRPRPRISKANILELKAHDWPGNVRELQNVIERAVITASSSRLTFDLPKTRQAPSPAPRTEHSYENTTVRTEAEMKAEERANLTAALTQTRWKVFGPGGAAELLQMPPTTLTSRIKKLGLKKPRGD